MSRVGDLRHHLWDLYRHPGRGWTDDVPIVQVHGQSPLSQGFHDPPARHLGSRFVCHGVRIVVDARGRAEANIRG